MLHFLTIAAAYLAYALGSAQSLCSLGGPPVEQYLYLRYLETPKVDRGGSFAGKDLKAATRAHMSLERYVIGGMEPSFRLRLYRLMRALDARGFRPGITSGYRGDYRQALAHGRDTNRPGHSFHGGSLVGGWGHGEAADLVALAPTRAAQLKANPKLWAAIDRLAPRFGLGRPYGNGDAPHVAPRESPEFAVAARKRARRARLARLRRRRRHKMAHHRHHKGIHVAKR